MFIPVPPGLIYKMSTGTGSLVHGMKSRILLLERGIYLEDFLVGGPYRAQKGARIIAIAYKLLPIYNPED